MKVVNSSEDDDENTLFVRMSLETTPAQRAPGEIQNRPGALTNLEGPKPLHVRDFNCGKTAPPSSQNSRLPLRR